ncbi:MAG: alpha/beta hydrolase family protein [Rubricella sp.]
MSWFRPVVGIIAAIAAAISIWQLEAGRAGIGIERANANGIPMTIHSRDDAGPAPVVVIAHGFAGSRQLMEPFALTLAEAGYIAVSFDFMGHGRNPAPMQGDVTRIDGTTQLMMDEVGAVATAALAHPRADGRLALLGHSMASDIVVRQGIADERVGSIVAISMFSEAVERASPWNLLMITGEWEPFLRTEALRALRLARPGANEGETIGTPGETAARRAVVAPGVEHVGVLYSGTSLREARAWLDATFGRESDGPVAMRGGWIALLLVSLILLAWPLARLLPKGEAPARLPRGRFLLAALVPALAVPLAIAPWGIGFLPVLVADYLALHFAAYGVVALLIAGRRDLGLRAGPILMALVVAAYGLFVFGGALDAYVASFWPSAPRVPIILAIAGGAVPFMLADAVLTEAGRAPLWRTLLVRGAFLASLGIAVAIDLERLFFLIIIVPVILLFFLLFGMLGGWVGRRTGAPVVPGLANGLILAWALGCTFPLVAS